VTTQRTRNEIGATGETLAALELQNQGMEILDRNWSCRWGELDVVALDRSEGRRLRQLAAEWLNHHPALSVDGVRLDAIGVLLQRDQKPVLVHITGIGDQ
jgi:putative endonuclease